MIVSIIITNHNYADYLTDAIESALRQSYAPIEVLVVDDGSTDASRSIIKRYAERIIPIFKKNAGQISSVNVGFSRCSGDVVIFLDADDVLYEDAVQRHVEKLRLPSVVKSYGYLDVTDRDLVPTGALIPRGKLSGSGDYRALLLKYGPSACPTAFTSAQAWSRSFLQTVLPLPEQPPSVGPDGYLSAVDPLFGRIEYVEGSLGMYRLHGTNTGPESYQSSDEYFRKRVEGYFTRAHFASEKAHGMGYSIDVKRWQRYADWKVMVARYILFRHGAKEYCITFTDFALSPLRAVNVNILKGLLRASMLAAVWIAPKHLGLRFARHLLDKSWGRSLVPERTQTPRLPRT